MRHNCLELSLKKAWNMSINLKRLTPKQLDDLARQIEAYKSSGDE